MLLNLRGGREPVQWGHWPVSITNRESLSRQMILSLNIYESPRLKGKEKNG